MISRRTFGKAVGVGTAAASLGAFGASPSQAASQSVGPIKQVDAGELNVGYAEVGPARGRPVILLHGWPYDIHSFVDVAPMLARMGYRVIVPHLRGHGTTRFRSHETFRNGQQAVFAFDLVALLDALKIDNAVLAGYDWGARAADIVAALWPSRVKALVTTGYLVVNREANKEPLPPAAEWAWWYQYYFATERGRLGLDRNRHDLAKLIWKFNSPTWDFSDATFDRTAASFGNPDYVDIVIHNYRWRQGLAQGDPKYDDLEARLAKRPTIAVPTVALDPEKDPFTAPPGDGSSYRDRFTGRYEHRILRGIGHNSPKEAPRAWVDAIRAADNLGG